MAKEQNNQTIWLKTLLSIHSQPTPLLDRILEEQLKRGEEDGEDLEYGKMVYMVDKTGALIDKNIPTRKLIGKFKESLEKYLILKRKRNMSRNKGVQGISDAEGLRKELEKPFTVTSLIEILKKHSKEFGKRPLIILNKTDYLWFAGRLRNSERVSKDIGRHELELENGLSTLKALPLSAVFYPSEYADEGSLYIVNPKNFYFSLNDFDISALENGFKLKVEVSTGTRGGLILELGKKRKFKKKISRD